MLTYTKRSYNLCDASAGGAREKSKTHQILYWPAGPVTSKRYWSDGDFVGTGQR